MSDSELIVQFTGPAEADIAKMDASHFGGMDPKAYHVKAVQDYQSTSTDPIVQAAKKARVRAAAHSGGTDPNEKEHLTVSYHKTKSQNTTVHIYTGLDSS
ncbi:hypothetical protein CVT24_006693 [Panaeolus cyanescens]|uniref:Uncharacterized protein n=1 Tax=Panaeolus cyanescens TaxID=181874 RepID=A0A409X1B8_9AGAR|nr:hypothetical protein CVT24_006693 [Panaeolus cyanescens]